MGNLRRSATNLMACVGSRSQQVHKKPAAASVACLGRRVGQIHLQQFGSHRKRWGEVELDRHERRVSDLEDKEDEEEEQARRSQLRLANLTDLAQKRRR